jgi:hypothetical protein
MKCAVVSKLFFGELPYLKSFLEYYLNIGIQKFYFVNTIPEYYDMIIEYLDDYISNDIIHIENINDIYKTRFNMCVTQLLPIIKEKYILHVDCDEYLWIKPYIMI